ncbi:MAG: hypothetical protein JWO07_216 [Candidatus Saccharibacteria bacterium]|nr:hypothetical protein [Candidatus Saccharibacteria bacterium]
MPQRKKKSSRRRNISPTLASLFKMTREELQTRKQTGGGVHRPKTLEHMPRSTQKRRAIDEQLD